uniref:Cystatin domain-containing protein n=1 Tax=Oryzias melastigma TaxID=30732 RepID=A0A3B3CV75_ORYME
MWKLAVLFLTALFAVGFGQMPGGVTDIDINDKGAKFALNHAMEKYNRDSNDIYLYKVVKVIKVQGQVSHIWIRNLAIFYIKNLFSGYALRVNHVLVFLNLFFNQCKVLFLPYRSTLLCKYGYMLLKNP